MLSRLKIGARLALGFAVLLALAALTGGFALSRLAEVNGNTKDLATNWLVASQALGHYSDAQNVVRRSEVSTVLARAPQEYQEQVTRIAAARKTAQAAWDTYAATITPGEEQQLATRIQQTQAAYEAEEAKTVAAAEKPEMHDAALAQYLGGSRKAFADLSAAIQADIDLQARGGKAAYESSQASYAGARLEVFGLLGLAIVVGTLLAWRITVSITRPLGAAVAVAHRVAQGDLQVVETATSADETGQLLRSLGAMQRSLVEVVAQVRTSADSIATGTGQIAAGNADLSQRTEEQASNLQQTAASMEQLTATVRQNADSARSAMQLADGAATAAAHGHATVAGVVSTMARIEEASRKVGDIIGVIDGIAFQTNILALNAAVEAARAGENGRGFAVVAAEVGSLAKRSANAAKEIKGLIASSTQSVAAGSAQVAQAGEAIRDISGRVTQVNEFVAQIATASHEQSTGIGQVGDAITQLDQVTQQNAALVEESAAAAESLKGQANKLAEMVSFFQI